MACEEDGNFRRCAGLADGTRERVATRRCGKENESRLQMRARWTRSNTRAPLGLAAWAFLFVLFGAEKDVRADEAIFDIRRFAPPTDPQASLVLEPVTTPGHLAWTLGYVESYAHRVLVLKDASGHQVSVPVRDQLSFDASFNIGIGERLAFGLRIPAVMAQTGDAVPNSDFRASRTALGDPMLEGKATLLPRGALGGFGLSALGRLTLPLGDRDSGAASRGITGQLLALGEIDWIIAAVRASAGILVRSEKQGLFSDIYGNEVPWAVGLVVRPRAFGIDPQGRWQWFLESNGALALTPKFGAARGSPATFGMGSRYTFAQDFSALAGVQLPLDSAVGVPSVRFVLGITWAPRFQDSDGDGIADDKDDCPELAEDKDGVEDDDGCPED